MKKITVVIIFSCFATSVIAQQTPTEQALSSKLMFEIETGLRCSVTAISVQKELAEAQAKIKKLEEELAKK